MIEGETISRPNICPWFDLLLGSFETQAFFPGLFIAQFRIFTAHGFYLLPWSFETQAFFQASLLPNFVFLLCNHDRQNIPGRINAEFTIYLCKQQSIRNS